MDLAFVVEVLKGLQKFAEDDGNISFVERTGFHLRGREQKEVRIWKAKKGEGVEREGEERGRSWRGGEGREEERGEKQALGVKVCDGRSPVCWCVEIERRTKSKTEPPAKNSMIIQSLVPLR